MKISFDYDSTLSLKYWQLLATKYLAAGHDVWIVTYRFMDGHPLNRFTNNGKVIAVATVLGIPIENIIFTNMEPKWKSLEGFDMHYDDDEVEIDDIKMNLHPQTIGILV